MTCFRCSIDTGRSWTYLFPGTGEPENREGLHLYVTNMQTKLRRPLKGLMERTLMGDISWSSSQNTVQMQKESIEAGLRKQVRNQRPVDQEVEVLHRGTGALMIVEIGTMVGGDLYVTGMIGMNIVKRIEVTAAEVLAEASVLDVIGVAVEVLDVFGAAVEAD